VSSSFQRRCLASIGSKESRAKYGLGAFHNPRCVVAFLTLEDWTITMTRKNQPITRREFSAACAAVGAWLTAVNSTFVATASAVNAAGPKVQFRDGTIVPALGQGSWHLGQGRHPANLEAEALGTGLSLGMTLIDTSGNYGAGRSEELIHDVIADQRDRVFLVSKVETDQVTGDGMAGACAASLARLGTSYLDLYLLHWPVSNALFAEVVAGFENLRAAGKIRAWGVSNFSVRQMEDLFLLPGGDRCATNQVLYSLSDRGIERDLLPWCEQHGIPVMAYSPLGGDSGTLVRDPTLARIGAAHNCSAAAIALAWAIRGGNVIAIPESGSVAHVKENAVALSLKLKPDELRVLDVTFPGPAGAN
jgi:diketogulonate reductase-like aldo/keto reductase